MSFPSQTVEGPGNQLNWFHLSSFMIIGVGDPEGAVKGRIGAIFLRTDGEAGTTLYVKESGEGTDEGWGAVNSPITASDLAASAKELFPQLAEVASRKVAFSTSSVKLAKEATQSAIVEVTHGVGATPTYVGIQSEIGGVENVLSPRVFEKTSTKFKLVFNTTPKAGAELTIPFSWVAIG